MTYSYLSNGQRAALQLPNGSSFTYSYSPLTTPSPTSDKPDELCRPLVGIADDAGRQVDITTAFHGRLASARYNKVYDGSGNLVSWVQSDYAYQYVGLTPGPGVISNFTTNRLSEIKTTA